MNIVFSVENLEEYTKFLTTNLLGLYTVVETLQSQGLPPKVNTTLSPLRFVSTGKPVLGD